MADVLSQLGYIAFYIVLPLLLLTGTGYVIQKYLGLDIPTLTKLNFYLTGPAMIYLSIIDSELTPGSVASVVGFSLLMVLVTGVLLYGLARWRKIPGDQVSALAMTGMFYNAGNYGLPLQQLAFRAQGLGNTAMALQVFVMIVQNIVSFTLGIVMAAGGGFDRQRLKQNWGHIVKFPPIYALGLGLLTVGVRSWLGDSVSGVSQAVIPFMDTLRYMQDGFIVIAVATLGATLATVKREGPKYPVGLAVFVKLLIAPVLGFGLVKVMGFEGLIAQVMLISTATPTAVNCLLLCVEFDNHPEFVARSVFYSTLISPITVTLVVLLAKSGLV